MTELTLRQLLHDLPEELASRVHFSIIEGNELRILVRKEDLVAAASLFYERYGSTLVSMHASDEREIDHSFKIYVILAPSNINGFITIMTAIDPASRQFPTLTPAIPAADWYEREIQDMLGLVATGHPDPRPLVLYDDWPSGTFPLRKDFKADTKVPRVKNEYPFFHVEGDGVFEIPVGPVHAGVIEPGHFRFSVAGEPIINLEIRMGYVHKGIEKISERTPYCQGPYLAERISGDNGVAHSTAYCQTVEQIASVRIPERAEYIRTIYLEMERLYNLFGDIAGIALDTAYSVGAAHGYILREKMLNLNECITGSRLLRSVNVLGGVRKDLSPNGKEKLLAHLVTIKLEYNDLVEMVTKSPSLLDRTETTGIISAKVARDLNVVGPAARGSGVDRDVRRDHPYAAYKKLSFIVPRYKQGDVNARMHVKMDEVVESFSIIEQALDNMPSGDISVPVKDVPADRVSFSLVESPRGELVHWIMSGDKAPYRHKIRDASFCNWLAMEQAVLGNIVPDFPLINKSLNLSYSGNDL